MDQDVKNIIVYLRNELNKVSVSGAENIAHMTNMFIGLNELQQKVMEQPKEAKKREEDKPAEEPKKEGKK